MRLLAVFLLMLPLQARADDAIDRVLNTVVLPGVSRFAETTTALAEAAKADCTPESPALQTAWNAAMDAWLGIQDLRFGPLDEGARRQAIAYWPDTTGHRPRALSRILSGQGTILETPETYAEQPVSARGLFAIESMLYDPDFNAYGAGDAGCVLVRAASADLARTGADIQQGWLQDFVAVMRTAGAPANTRFLDPAEARQAVFTALLTSLQFDIDERLGLPLGTFDKPRPLRAEGRLSGRAQRNLELGLAAHQALALALIPDPTLTAGTRAEFAKVRLMANKLNDNDFSGVDDPSGRFRLETLQAAMTVLRTTVTAELGAALGVTMGLNALDGD